MPKKKAESCEEIQVEIEKAERRKKYYEQQEKILSRKVIPKLTRAERTNRLCTRAGTMAIFDVAQHVINASAGIIGGSTAIDASALESIEETLKEMELGPLFGLFLQSFVVQLCSLILSVLIFVIVYGRMIEIYLMVSLAPIPFATFGNREQSQIGQNYLRSLAALGFQGFLIMICIGIYAVLVQTVAFSDDIIASIWAVMGYTVLLCFTLFKTGTLAKSVFSAH